MGPLQKDVMAAVRAGAQTTEAIYRAVSEHVNVSRDAIRVILYRLVQQQRLRRVRYDLYVAEERPVFSKAILLNWRRAVVMLLKAIDDALLEGYGWTPRKPQDIDAVCYTDKNVPEGAKGAATTVGGG